MCSYSNQFFSVLASPTGVMGINAAILGHVVVNLDVFNLDAYLTQNNNFYFFKKLLKASILLYFLQMCEHSVPCTESCGPFRYDYNIWENLLVPSLLKRGRGCNVSTVQYRHVRTSCYNMGE